MIGNVSVVHAWVRCYAMVMTHVILDCVCDKIVWIL